VFGIAFVMSDLIPTVVEPVIADEESVASSVDEELVARMAENFEEFEVYQDPYHFTHNSPGDQDYLNAPDSICTGVYYNTFGGGPEGGYFVVKSSTNPLIEWGQVYTLERTWGEKFKWSYTSKKVERQLYKEEDTFDKDGRPHIRVWKDCPPPRFRQASPGAFTETGFSLYGCKKLMLPFYLMGSPGERSAITTVEYLQRPKQINQAFLLRVADKLDKNCARDWDWNAFRRNLIEPNFNHIQILHRITDPKVMSHWIDDLYVFLNNSKEKDIVERKRGQPNKIHLAPSIKNINSPDVCDY
jgi:hypothetical protein